MGSSFPNNCSVQWLYASPILSDPFFPCCARHDVSFFHPEQPSDRHSANGNPCVIHVFVTYSERLRQTNDYIISGQFGCSETMCQNSFDFFFEHLEGYEWRMKFYNALRESFHNIFGQLLMNDEAALCNFRICLQKFTHSIMLGIVISIVEHMYFAVQQWVHQIIVYCLFRWLFLRETGMVINIIYPDMLTTDCTWTRLRNFMSTSLDPLVKQFIN